MQLLGSADLPKYGQESRFFGIILAQLVSLPD
jgi:hypothetical protein